VDEILRDLRDAGIALVVDVRELPLSRKSGFSKSALAKALRAGGIEYVGMRAVGAPRQARHALREGGAWEPFATAYLAHLEANEDGVAEVERLARERPVALLCFERDALACHRSLLAGRLARRGFDVVHL
jgi:uncharacterized protein (DUF488 family)